MKKTQILVALAVLLVVVLLSVWAVQGYNIYTKTAYAVTVTDELFGTTSVEWRPGFRLGLDIAGSASAVAAAAAVAFWWYKRRAAQHSAHA